MLSVITLFKFWGLLTLEDIINFKMYFLCSSKHHIHAPPTVNLFFP